MESIAHRFLSAAIKVSSLTPYKYSLVQRILEEGYKVHREQINFHS